MVSVLLRFVLTLLSPYRYIRVIILCTCMHMHTEQCICVPMLHLVRHTWCSSVPCDLHVVPYMYAYYIGHYLDQKRLREGLYRHPWDDISYLSPDVAM